MSEKVNCPFCGNIVEANAYKCQTCGSLFEDPNLPDIKFKEFGKEKRGQASYAFRPERIGFYRTGC